MARMLEIRTQRIATLNDVLRNSLPAGGRVTLTAGVDALGPIFIASALAAVIAFKDFNADNDPWGEHDFGSFEIDGETLFWKIDYYDGSMQFGSEDPADPAKTMRVLTIMLSEEY